MRVGILANSFSAARKIQRDLAIVPDIETFILLSPSAERSAIAGRLANVAQLGMCAIKDLRARPLSMVFSRRLLFLTKGFNHPSSVAAVEALELDVGLHKAGVIYREPIIKAFRLGILNPHIGLLPAYRGRNVMEWSLLNGDPVGITVFFIDCGIDTGSRIVLSEEVDISHCRSISEAKQYLFDLDVTFFRKALSVLREEKPSFKVNDGSGRRYYVMSKLFQSVVSELIQGSN